MNLILLYPLIVSFLSRADYTKQFLEFISAITFSDGLSQSAPESLR